MWRRKYLSDDEIVVQNIVITPGPWISASRAVPPCGYDNEVIVTPRGVIARNLQQFARLKERQP